MRVAMLKTHDWSTWADRHARGEVAGELGPYGAERLRGLGFSPRWSDGSHRLPWRSPLLMRPLRKLGAVRPELIGLREALVSLRAVHGADAVLTLFEDQGMAAASARAAGLAPFSRRPLVIVACWLAETCRGLDARTLGAYRRALAGADRVCFFSRNQGPTLERELGLPARSLRSVPFGIDTDFFAPRAPPEAGYILSIGQDAGRDHQTLLDAVRGTDMPVRLVAPLRELAATAPPNVELIWRTVEHRDYRELLAGAAVVAIPTSAPAYPSGQTVVLEAMAMGKPVVTTDSAAMRDYVEPGRTGLLVPAREPRALAEALRRLLDDAQLRDALGGAAREQARRSFSHLAMWSALASVLEELAPRSSPVAVCR